MARPKNCGCCKKIKTICKCGRPRIDLEKLFEVIKPFLQRGLSIHASSLQAQVCYETVWKHYNIEEPEEDRNIQFIKKINRAMAFADVKAQTVIIDDMSDNKSQTSVHSAKWWLERRKHKEFAPMQKNLHGEDRDNPFISLADAAKQLKGSAGSSTVPEQAGK